MAYDNTNTGMLRKNTRKEKDTHPDYRGKINVGGVEYWLSGWIKVGREGTKLAGEKYFSLSVQPIEEEQPRRTSASRYPARRTDDRREERRDDRRDSRDEDPNDDIPF